MFKLIVIFSLSICFSQNDILMKEKNIFQRNVSLYQKGQYENVAKNFSILVERLPNSRFITVYRLMLAKTYYKLHQYKKSIDLSNNFIKLFPNSSYCDDMFYNIGNCYYKSLRYETAIKTWIDALDYTDDNRLKAKLIDLILAALNNKLDRGTLKNIKKNIASKNGLMLMQIANAENSLKQGDFMTASNVLNKALKKYPDTGLTTYAKNLLAATQGKRSNMIRIALLLPLQGVHNDIVSQIKDGIEFAVDEFNHKNKIKIELILKDYGDDIFEAINLVKKLAQDRSIVSVFGPIDNDAAAACAAISEYEKLPLGI